MAIINYKYTNLVPHIQVLMNIDIVLSETKSFAGLARTSLIGRLNELLGSDSLLLTNANLAWEMTQRLAQAWNNMYKWIYWFLG